MAKVGDELIEVISLVRKFKTDNKKSMKEPVILTLPDKRIYKEFIEDLKAVCQAREIRFSKEFKVEF